METKNMAYNEFVTYEMMYKDIMYHLIPKLPRDIKAIMGIPRSGMIAASMISTELHIPMGIMGCDKFFSGNRVGSDNGIKSGKILVIDDSVNSGKTFGIFEKDIKCLSKNFEVVKAAVYMKKGGENIASLFARYLDVPRIFEWNLFNSFKIQDMILDMDGVLCQDPTIYDDDGIDYQNNITNAIPLHIPKYPVKAICTSRLERWRSITENWLQYYGVKYGKLIMSSYATADERRKKGDKSAYKAKYYVNLNGSLFIESSSHQAKRIASIAKRNVLSLEDKKIYLP